MRQELMGGSTMLPSLAPMTEPSFPAKPLTIIPSMNESPVAPLDDLANDYAARWSAERPAAPEAVRPANHTELRRTLEANEAFLYLTEFLPNYSRCGINE